MAAHVVAGPYHACRVDVADLSDDELVRRLQDGDPAVEAEVLSRWRPRLVGWFVKRLHDEAIAEDLAHDVLASVLPSLGALDLRRPVWPWLMTIAGNRLVDHYRQTSPRRDPADDVAYAVLRPLPLQDMDDVIEVVDAVCDRPTVRQAIGGLTPRQRFAILRYEVDGWSTERIAEVLGTNNGAVRQILKRARRSARREYLTLTGGRAPWALVPLLPLWVRDRLRRAALRMRSTVQEWQATVSAGGESVLTAAGLATTVTAAAAVTWIGAGPPAVAVAAPPAPEVVAVAVDQHGGELTFAGGTLAADLIPVSASSSVAAADPGPVDSSGVSDADLAPGVYPAEGNRTPTPEASDDGASSSTESAADVLQVDTDEVDTTDVDPPEPEVESDVGSGPSDHYDNGEKVDSEANVTVDNDVQPVDVGASAPHDINCDHDANAAICDPPDPEGDEVATGDVDAGDDSTQAASDEVAEAEEDASDVDVITEDNCSLDESVSTVCDAAEDPAL